MVIYGNLNKNKNKMKAAVVDFLVSRLKIIEAIDVRDIDKAKEMENGIEYILENLKSHLEINAGRLCKPLLDEGKDPRNDKNCHKAFLMLAHLEEIENYLTFKPE